MAIFMKAVADAIAAEEAAKKSGSGGNGNYLNLSKMQPDTNALVRILPREDENLLPYVTKYWINLPFYGMVNSDNDHEFPVSVRVPSLKTWGLNDFILQSTAPYWRGTQVEKDTIARVYYHKPSYIMACLAVSLPFVEDFTPDNPVRKLAMSKQMFVQFKEGLANPDLEYAPWDVDHGRDFRGTKVLQGGFPNYTRSQWSYKERPLSDTERAAIAQHGLPDLEAEIGEPPTVEQQGIIKAMFLASLAGEPFDNKQWGSHYRAYSPKQDTPSSTRGNGTTTTATSSSFQAPAELMEKLRVKSTIVKSSTTTEEAAAAS